MDTSGWRRDGHLWPGEGWTPLARGGMDTSGRERDGQWSHISLAQSVIFLYNISSPPGTRNKSICVHSVMSFYRSLPVVGLLITLHCVT